MDSNPPATPDPSKSEKTLRSVDLFEGRRIVWIEHDGERYRLLITARGRLMLQK